MRTMYIGTTGMQAQQLNVEVIANNIANISTTGFKRSRAEFQDLLYDNIRRVGSPTSDTGTLLPSGLQVGMGVKPVATYRIHENGVINITEGTYDVAINGRGFLQIQMPDGTINYTRDGSLQTNENGEIVTQDGFLLSPNISVPEDAMEVIISRSGEVLARIDGQTALQSLGQIQLAAFINPSGLEAIGDNLFRETEASGTPITGDPQSDGFGYLMQGALESSNVNVVAEITTLITAQRAYEMNARVITAGDEMMTTISQMR
ncbi:MAG: flagellar basal-body rod protein FlgG [Alphaproteobacteria bacterium]|nr:flagellar basal-body rod protein FlgG [Alphaproteobacteria bacterium]